MKNVISKYSENIAGAISLSGSLILILLGDIKSIAAAITFTIAELILTRFGNKTLGYSISALCFIIGNIFLIYSVSLTGDTWVQLSLWGMSFAWSIGFLRYFVEKLGYLKTANNMPAVTGTLNILFKFPGIFFAIHSGDYIVALAITMWMLADIFAGRLQEKMSLLFKFLKS